MLKEEYVIKIFDLLEESSETVECAENNFETFKTTYEIFLTNVTDPIMDKIKIIYDEKCPEADRKL